MNVNYIHLQFKLNNTEPWFHCYTVLTRSQENILKIFHTLVGYFLLVYLRSGWKTAAFPF